MANAPDVDKTRKLIETSSRLEIDISKVYHFLSDKFPEDHQFWWQLATEEEDHSAIYESFLRSPLLMDVFPLEIVDHDLAGILSVCEQIEADLPVMGQWELSKAQFYEYALTVEQASSEGKFQQAMLDENPSRFLRTVQRINADEIRHKERIEELIDDITNES